MRGQDHVVQATQRAFEDVVVRARLYRDHFNKPPVICLSVSSSRTYHRTENQHPVLGVEYEQDQYSLTDEYFQKMGLKV
ncbi:putative oxygenase MesX, partial [Klebsiella variicola]|uniref:putative oxygenase MesX n=1 Tax=Klebsiella variicola TaxID=244366 RepID=UPI003F6D54F7